MLNIAALTKWAPPPIIGHRMVKSIVYPAVRLNTDNFSLPLLLKMFTTASEIL